MDFFETRERYRRREMRSYISLLLRVLVVGGVLWLGWLWGHAETGSLRAEAERTLYENNQQITELSTEVQRLKMELAEARAKNKVDELAQDNDAELKALGDRARDLKAKRVQQLGELVVATGADTLDLEVLAGILRQGLLEAKLEKTREAWRADGVAFFRERGRNGKRGAQGDGSGARADSQGDAADGSNATANG